MLRRKGNRNMLPKGARLAVDGAQRQGESFGQARAAMMGMRYSRDPAKRWFAVEAEAEADQVVSSYADIS